MADFKVPGWFVHFKYQHVSGKFNPGSFQERAVAKPAQRNGSYQVTDKYKARDITKPTGAFNSGGYQDRSDVDKKGRDDTDPWGAYYFSLEIDNVEVAHFSECSGLKSSAEIFEVEEGGYLSNTHKRTGRSKWENIILKRAVSKGHLFEEWRDYFMQFPADGWTRRASASAAIVQRANDGTELRRYSILQPWPVSWEGPSLSSGGSALAEETLEIAHEGILFGRPPAPQPEPPPPEPQEEQMETVNCEFDKTDYTKQGAKNMDKNVETINKDPNAKTYYVEGHTCDMGSYSYNLTLSSNRASAAASDLNERAGKDKKYESAGFSYKWQAAPNTSESNRAQNRRVNIWPSPRPAGARSGETLYNGPKPLG